MSKLLKQWKCTGNIEPKPHNGGQELKLSSQEIIILGELVETNNDATLQEWNDLLDEKTEAKVSN